MKLPQTVRVTMTGHEAALLLNLLEQARTEAQLAQRVAGPRPEHGNAMRALMRAGRVHGLIEDALLSARTRL